MLCLTIAPISLFILCDPWFHSWYSPIIRIIRSRALTDIHDFMSAVTVIGIGRSSAISTSKIIKITAIRKNRDEKGIRAEFFGSNPHSNGDLFSRSLALLLPLTLWSPSILLHIDCDTSWNTSNKISSTVPKDARHDFTCRSLHLEHTVSRKKKRDWQETELPGQLSQFYWLIYKLPRKLMLCVSKPDVNLWALKIYIGLCLHFDYIYVRLVMAPKKGQNIQSC